MERPEFKHHLRVTIAEALAAAEESPDVRDEEPFLVRLVMLAKAHPEHDSLVEDELIRLSEEVGRTPYPFGSVELLSYAVHALQVPRLVMAIEAARSKASPLGHGGRPWEWARRYERILQAQYPDWPDRDLFPSLNA